MSQTVKSYSAPCPYQYCRANVGEPCRVGLYWRLGEYHGRRAHYTHAGRKRAVAALPPTPTNGAQP